MAISPLGRVRAAFEKTPVLSTQRTYIPASADTVAFSGIPSLRPHGNALHVVTFSGLHNPLFGQAPALQMRVRGVTNHQRSSDPKARPLDHSINDLADSKWKDGQALTYKLATTGSGRRQSQRIELDVPGVGPVGRVPDEIAKKIAPFLKKYPNDFRFELSNVIAGTTKGAETIGLRVNLVYTGASGAKESEVRAGFNVALNSPDCKDTVMLYQSKTSPAEVLKLILDHEKLTAGDAARQQMETVIDTIAKKIEDPNNKRILLLGHCKPDGDTLGCVVGLKNAIELMDPSRTIDMAVDDKIPGLFRNKVPGVDDIKRPHNPGRVAAIEQEIALLKKEEQTEAVKNRIEILEQEKTELSDPNNLLDPKAQYDLVITMDVPTPKRFTDSFKPYFDTAKDAIYIDHHPFRYNEWDAAAPDTGFDMKKSLRNNLVWVADSVAAATQMVGILGDRLVPGFSQVANGKKVDDVFKTPAQRGEVDRFAAGLVTGMSTDTGSFTRTANLTPQDLAKPVQDRPNFAPEGEAKWLMDLTNGNIDKKWLRENVTYDIPDKTLKDDTQASARDLMLTYALKGKSVYPDISLGLVQVDYDQMNDVWQTAREVDPEVTLLDVQNAFKYSEVMGTLRGDPSKQRGGRKSKPADPNAPPSLRAKEDYQGKYDDKRVAILVCQDKKKGELDEKVETAKENGLRLSLRSGDGTEDAELLASLFGGGGHGAAAGGRVDLPGVTLDTKLGVLVNGATDNNPVSVLAALKKNYAVMKDDTIAQQDKQSHLTPIALAADVNGKTTAEWIKALVVEIRKTQTPTK